LAPRGDEQLPADRAVVEDLGRVAVLRDGAADGLGAVDVVLAELRPPMTKNSRPSAKIAARPPMLADVAQR
jgi:hypothetical protein